MRRSRGQLISTKIWALQNGASRSRKCLSLDEPLRSKSLWNAPSCGRSLCMMERRKCVTPKSTLRWGVIRRKVSWAGMEWVRVTSTLRWLSWAGGKGSSKQAFLDLCLGSAYFSFNPSVTGILQEGEIYVLLSTTPGLSEHFPFPGAPFVSLSLSVLQQVLSMAKLITIISI